MDTPITLKGKNMSFFKAKKKAEDVKQGGDSKYINGSGFYPVNVIAPFVSTSPKGSMAVDLFINHLEQKQALYGNLRITNNNDAEGNTVHNAIGSKVFNQLVVIADVDDVSEPIEAELPRGKKGKMEDSAVLEDLADVDVIVRIQMEYSKYNGTIQEKKVIKAFFRASDNASAEEIVNDSEVGLHFAKEQKYADSVTYKDGLDEAAITAWVAGGRGKGGAAANSAPTKTPGFGKKTSFGKKAD